MPEILDLIEAAQQGNERAMENLIRRKDIPVFSNRYYAERVWESISCEVREPYRTDYGVGFDYGVYGEDFSRNGSFEWLGGVKVDSLENLPAGMTVYYCFGTVISEHNGFIAVTFILSQHERNENILSSL